MQKKLQYTQGPWEITEAGRTIPIKAKDGKTVVNIPFCDNDLDDARLIAAAPELLGALESILDYCYLSLKESIGMDEASTTINVNDFRKKANAAVAKARGQ